MSTAQILTFGRYRLDLANAQLWQGKQAIVLPKQTLAVLHYLVEHVGQVVTKEELFAQLWPGTAVSDGALTYCIVELRKALGDNAKQPKFIETVHRRGYRFLPTVTISQAVSPRSPVVDSEEKARAVELGTSAFSPQASNPTPQAPNFVGREAELKKLHTLLVKALNGHRQLVFLSGEPGIGKTTVARVFLAEVDAAGLAVVGHGQCVEHYGPGEPYLPVLEAIGRLRRSPEGAFIPAWLRQHAPAWLFQLPSFVEPEEYEQLQLKLKGSSRERMLRELLEAVEFFTPEHPLILLLEDLQWSDYSTLELLSACARRSDPARFLVLGTYRPAEGLADTHPLRALRQELLAHGHCSELNLQGLPPAQVEHYLTQRFPRATVPPQLVVDLQQRTEGNPFFLVNLVNDLLEQHVLTTTNDGGMVQYQPELIATNIPHTSRQLIERQMERLSKERAQMLMAASVVGTEFATSAVAAAVQLEEEEVEEQCEDLVRREEFLRRAGMSEWPDGTRAVKYAFRHALYQELWHERIPLRRAQRFHLRIGERLEQGYRGRTGEVAVELAIHFEEGRDFRKATYYRAQAADVALQRHAYQEAVLHLKKGLEFLTSVPDMPDRLEQELKLRSLLGMSLQVIQGYGDPVVEGTYARARELSQQIREPAQLFLVLFGLWQFHLTRAEYPLARELGEQLLSLAQSSRDRALLVEAYGAVGVTDFLLGELLTARTTLEEAIARYDFQEHRTLAFTYGQDPWVACAGNLGQVLWLLGYPDQARQRCEQIVQYAQELGHPFTQAFALSDCALIYQYIRDVVTVQRYTEGLSLIVHEHKFPFWELAATTLQGWLLTEQGQGMKAVAQMRQGASVRKATGTALRLPYYQANLVVTYKKSGLVDDGLSQLEKSFATVARTGERWWEAELYRLRGELLLQQEDQKGKSETNLHPPFLTSQTAAQAEACFQKAIAIAQGQHAKSLELRATTSLAHLWQAQGKAKKAHSLLSAIYGWFTEGFDTKDLHEAKALLATLK